MQINYQEIYQYYLRYLNYLIELRRGMVYWEWSEIIFNSEHDDNLNFYQILSNNEIMNILDYYHKSDHNSPYYYEYTWQQKLERMLANILCS